MEDEVTDHEGLNCLRALLDIILRPGIWKRTFTPMLMELAPKSGGRKNILIQQKGAQVEGSMSQQRVWIHQIIFHIEGLCVYQPRQPGYQCWLLHPHIMCSLSSLTLLINS